jgi:indole-3-glycerol phosphate synthase
VGVLETICEERREAALRARKARPASSLERAAGAPRPAFRADARIAEGRGLLIAECKKASPSRGLLVANYDPVRLAREYERGGALMVSVLTEPRHFLGADGHLASVRAAVGLPVLRKDFVVDPYQIAEAWAIGADAVLLIAAALGEAQMRELAAAARELGLAILAEVRDEGEIEAAAAAGPDAIGVNSRNLRDFSVDARRAQALVGLLPDGPLKIAESGLKSPEAAAELRRSGFQGFLVGEALATAADPEARTGEFVSAIDGRR